ncbi:hypothetical protein [Lactiplantibacillus pentosus]|uniref:hypothetical protein n=1 Tax=Lactiplantibacillus pentosus TaxID=1589 RepID=UPI001CD45936|nr:hypothetical protein [Lactiplantibacillus pentosus]MCJ8183912.1 hypothetical protein [Lactiplantibacillus pentosus]
MAESNATQVILTDDGIKIIKAQDTADNAAGGVANLNDPNLMSVIEKQNNVAQFAGLTSQYNVLVQNARDDGIDTTAVTTAYNNLNRFMADILADPDHASDVDRVTYKKYQDAYNEELAKLQNTLQNNTNNKFTSAANATRQAASAASQAFSEAQSAFNAANSTASEFGKVDQKAESALASALGAQSDASVAVKQASSAAADSKDAKQIAGAVSQSYKKLTDGSTMTIAELESGLAVKLTKSDLNGYATQTWTQNQIKMTADGINGTMSSIKSTVDSQTTSINDLKADSSSFKSQFTTVNNTLGKQSTDIGTLQATSKELTTGFNTLTSDNNTNKNDISQLKQTATEVSSTLETVQTQVQDSAVGTNLAIGTGQEYSMGFGIPNTVWQDGYAYLKLPLNTTAGEILPQNPHDFWYTLTKGTTYTQTIWFETDAKLINSNGIRFTWFTYAGHDEQPVTLINLGENKYKLYSTYTWPGKSNNNVRLFDIRSLNSAFDLSTGTYLKFGKLKLEKGSLSTDWCTNPADNASVTAFSKLSQTVDGMKSDISKKIEQKDLNGYATQTWTQNQIKVTADGINATLSSVKSTVDGQTTSINDLKADSSSFKSQFTTVNNTIGKQSTDISTLQATSKELTTGFNTLTTDNKTNTNDISQLKQTSTEISSTLETVQTQVQDSAVGTNLAIGTGQEYSMGFGIPNTVWQDGYAYLKLPLNTTAGEILPQNPHDFWYTLTKGTTYTQTIWFETDAKLINSNGIRFTWFTYAGHDEQPVTLINLGENKYKLYSTYTWPGKSNNNVRLFDIRSLNSAFDLSTGTYLKFGKLKLEKGSLSTDWCPNPADIATQSQFTQLSDDINLRVKKGDLVDQINIQAGNTLISSSGQLTLSGKSVFLDSVDPVIMKSANIDTLLVGKRLTAADISANTFTTNNGTFTVDKNGAITAKDMTLIGGTLTSPTINASTINGSTISGTTFHGGDIINDANNTSQFYPMTITPDGAYKSTYFDSAVGLQSSVESGAISYKYRSMIGNGTYLYDNVAINGQGITLDSGTTTTKDTNFSAAEVENAYISLTTKAGLYLHGSNANINFGGRLSDDSTSVGMYMNPYGNLIAKSASRYWQISVAGTDNSGGGPIARFGIDSASAYNIEFNRELDIGNFHINTGHTFTSWDRRAIHFAKGGGGAANIYAGAVHYTSLVKSSLLSVKRDVQKADTAYWAQLVNSIDLATYQYKTDDNTSHLRLSSIVDDVNDTKQWQLPDVFISRDEDGKLCGVDDSVLLNATLATVQEQQKEIDQLNGHNMELEARLNKLEAKLNG